MDKCEEGRYFPKRGEPEWKHLNKFRLDAKKNIIDTSEIEEMNKEYPNGWHTNPPRKRVSKTAKKSGKNDKTSSKKPKSFSSQDWITIYVEDLNKFVVQENRFPKRTDGDILKNLSKIRSMRTRSVLEQSYISLMDDKFTNWYKPSKKSV